MALCRDRLPRVGGQVEAVQVGEHVHAVVSAVDVERVKVLERVALRSGRGRFSAALDRFPSQGGQVQSVDVVVELVRSAHAALSSEGVDVVVGGALDVDRAVVSSRGGAGAVLGGAHVAHHGLVAGHGQEAGCRVVVLCVQAAVHKECLVEKTKCPF